MELNWLEDFLELIATRNFSTAAAARNISQSAFSRRIIALENWVGTPIIDRSTYPIQLTKAGALFLPRCRDIVTEIYRVQTDCQQRSDDSHKLIKFSTFHTIGLFFFPDWLRSLELVHGKIYVSMHMDNFHGCIEHLSVGKSDFAIAYDHQDGPAVLQDGPFERLKIGTEIIIPVSGATVDATPIFQFSEEKLVKTPFLSYSWDDGYFGKLLSLVLARQNIFSSLSTVYETSLAEGIKRMAIAGHGIGWLPLSSVTDPISRGELFQIGGAEHMIEMDVCIFRRKGNDEGELGQLWNAIGNLNSQK